MEWRFAKEVIKKSQRQFMYSSNFYESDVNWRLFKTFWGLTHSNLGFLPLGNVQCNDGVSCSFDNLDWDGEINSGDILDVAFVYHYNSNSEISVVSVNGVDICGSNVVRYVYCMYLINYLNWRNLNLCRQDGVYKRSL